MDLKLSCCLVLLTTFVQVWKPSAGESLQVNRNNVDDIVHSNELVLLLFYTERCKYSVQLMPIFDATADQLQSLFGDSGKVLLGKVDCQQEPEMQNDFDIGKYPTIKIVRHSHINREEYRGQRSTQAIMHFVVKELQDPIEMVNELNELENLVSSKYLVIAYFQSRDHIEYETYRKAASNLKDHCQFYVKISETQVQNELTFRQSFHHIDSYEKYSGNMSNFTDVLRWFQEKCDPTVRALTFQNAELITEEGKPFVILFHNTEDVTSIKEFTKVVNEELTDELENVNFLTADGKYFAHPLSHLNRTEADLPLIAIDSFVHMYLFPKYKWILRPGQLKEFVAKLHTGELHWALHFEESSEDGARSSEEKNTEEPVITSAPRSKFKELLPSKHRYTFARDEL